MVLADGSQVHASADEHPDLFWALRGGGGNFGVVTSFEFRTHPVGATVMAGPTFWPIEQTPEVMRWYREFIPPRRAQVSGFFALMTVPPVDLFPRGAAPAQGVRGDVVHRRLRGGRGAGCSRPCTTSARRCCTASGPMPHPALQGLFDGALHEGPAVLLARRTSSTSCPTR